VNQRLIEGNEEGGCDFAWMVDCREVMTQQKEVQRGKEDRSSFIICRRHIIDASSVTNDLNCQDANKETSLIWVKEKK